MGWSQILSMIMGGMGAGTQAGAYGQQAKHERVSKSRMMGAWLMEQMKRQPAMEYYKWLMRIAQNPEAYPQVMEKYLGAIMPQLNEWATTKGVYNPAAVSRKASENLFPFLMGLGQTGAAGLTGQPIIPIPQGGWHTPVTYPVAAAAGQWMSNMGGMMGGGGMGGGMGGTGGRAVGGGMLGGLAGGSRAWGFGK
jgi:hypothetical protein